jgi:hypothetical protein
MDEELFWRHYFHRCRTLRAEVRSALAFSLVKEIEEKE